MMAWTHFGALQMGLLLALLTACGSGGTPSQSTVPAPTIMAFNAMPSTIPAGNTSTLAYTFTNGTGAINPAIGSVTSGGSTPITPSGTITYTLTVTNTAGASVTATAKVTVDGGGTFTVQIPDASNPGHTVPMDFVLIPAGTFIMGSDNPLDTWGESFSKPTHTVTISQPFYLAKYECTQEQYRAVMNANPSHFQTVGGGSTVDDFTRPVEMVRWDDIRRPTTGFLAKLAAAVPGQIFRLPTEAEWEYACRAGTTTAYSFGEDNIPNVSYLTQYGWFQGISDSRTHPVGSKWPNPWGLYDMHGNVWEWNEDDRHLDYTGAPITGNPWIDVPVRGEYRMYRGGSWVEGRQASRSALRDFDSLFGRFYNRGFRLVCTVP
ncbi:MAG: formylglycine-generating enzyme family protein [Holophagaceae bacterium]|nr:formylglycine-generating enzyme family protein [Holophagaceae bacterium]